MDAHAAAAASKLQRWYRTTRGPIPLASADINETLRDMANICRRREDGGLSTACTEFVDHMIGIYNHRIASALADDYLGPVEEFLEGNRPDILDDWAMYFEDNDVWAGIRALRKMHAVATGLLRERALTHEQYRAMFKDFIRHFDLTMSEVEVETYLNALETYARDHPDLRLYDDLFYSDAFLSNDLAMRLFDTKYIDEILDSDDYDQRMQRWLEDVPERVARIRESHIHRGTR